MKSFFSMVPGTVMVIVGVWLIILGAEAVYHSWSSSSWPKTNGVIEESRIASSYSSGAHGGGSSYWPVITYVYTVDAHSYQGSSIGSRSFWNAETSQQVVKAYPSGSHCAVYFSPQDHRISRLITGVKRWSFSTLVLGTLILSFGTLFGGLAYLAPKYGRSSGGNSYSLDENSPLALAAVLGLLAIACEFGLLFWTFH